MKLLMDTHAFLWFVEGDTRLSGIARDAIANPVNELYLSIASIWELSIKVAKRKLTLNQPLESFIQQWVLIYGIKELEIQSRHALKAGALDPIHGDPFDRMLIAQAICENMYLVSRDTELRNYSAPIIW